MSTSRLRRILALSDDFGSSVISGANMWVHHFRQQCFAALVFLFSMIFVRHAIAVKDREFWYEEARAALRRRLQQNPPSSGARSHARNVILFVGDGMSVATVTAARILRGQRLGRLGEEQELAWDKFPAVGLVKTYNSDAQIGESSACATALMCGVKANFETLGLDTRGKFENCLSSFSSKVPSLIDWAQEEGKATGIVTNTRITHATPAALYAHVPSRYWEDDGKVPPASRKSCKDIARQLVEDAPGRNVNAGAFLKTPPMKSAAPVCKTFGATPTFNGPNGSYYNSIRAASFL